MFSWLVLESSKKFSIAIRTYIIDTTGGEQERLCYLLPITYYLLPITYYPLPITYYPLPITHYPLPITHYLREVHA